MSTVSLGLKQNWRQFSLLVLINAFVGGMVGIERTVVPLIGAEDFHIEFCDAHHLIHRQLWSGQSVRQSCIRPAG